MSGARDFSVTAIISAFNEEDVIGQVIADLAAQGVSVYLIDHGSTDETVAEAERLRGAGLVGLERFPDESGFPSEDAARYAWANLLRRKEALAHELPSTWFIHSDADELRESPWRDCTLREAILRVDELGFNAIDFAVYNFWPTHDRFRRGDDLRKSFPLYQRGAEFDKLQIKCWKRTGSSVSLAPSGGHEAEFPGRKVFPIRFLLRHYPIRTQAQGERKIFQDRKPRFVPEERANGWHLQYDAIAPGESLLRDPAALHPFDPEVARLDLLVSHRGVDELTERAAELKEHIDAAAVEREREVASLVSQLDAASADLDATRVRERDLAQRVASQVTETNGLSAKLTQLSAELVQHRDELAARIAERDAAQAEARELAPLRDDLRARSSELDEARAALDLRATVAEQLHADLAAAREELARTRQAAQLAAEENTRALAALEQLRREGEQLRTDLASRESALAEARAGADRDAIELAGVAEQRHAWHAERGALIDAMVSAQSESEALRPIRAERDQLRLELEAAQRRLDEARAQLAHAMGELVGAEQRIDSFYASRTWRLLAPARLAWRLVGKE